MRLKGDVRETILSKRFTLIRDKKGCFKRGCLYLPVLLLRCLKIELAVLNNGREFPTIPGMIGSVENLSVLSRHVS